MSSSLSPTTFLIVSSPNFLKAASVGANTVNGPAPISVSTQLAQVPIVINHAHKYISFGSPDPQLCVRYSLCESTRRGGQPLVIVQRFIFNLHWSPEQFAEYAASNSSEAGELDLF